VSRAEDPATTGDDTDDTATSVRHEYRPATAPAGMRARDLLDEAVAGLFARPGRTVLTVLGTVIGLGALVATLGLSLTAGSRIVGRFD
jgi:hypothetical protein